MTAVTLALLVAAFVLMNAIFVAAEFALVSLPRTAVEHRAAAGDRLARRLLPLLQSAGRQDRYIATAQLGITLASLGLGMFGEHELARLLAPHLHLPESWRWITAHGLAIASAVAILTVLDIVCGEMVPKSLALQRAEWLARGVYWPMQIAQTAAFPLVSALSLVGRGVLALLGIRRQATTHEQLHTPDELLLIVEESQRGGALRAEAGHLLKELFDFGDLTAGQVMVPRVRVVGIPTGATSETLRELLRTRLHTRYPVYAADLDHIVGMLHVKDLLRRLIANEGITAADARPVPVVPETQPLDDVLATMQRAHAHMAVVIDEHGGTAGVVSIEDLVEEVVGEIDDASIIGSADGTARVAGTVRLDELGAFFNVDLEHEDVDSVSGLVLARLGRPPEVGDVIQYQRLTLEVLSVAGRGVREVRATLQPADESSPAAAEDE